MSYCIYLRKSRADEELERQGEGETLARHRKALLDLAKKMKLGISDIYEEIVSGESIAARPEMQKMLAAIEQRAYDGVLVMEVERLARGNTIDQGIISQTFKYSDTKIVTPLKTYDPNNEYDEEYFEFGLFMSRREYNTTKRRLMRGREASAKEGKFVGSIPPYGYERMKIPNDKGWTLKQVPEQADVIKLIFEMYTVGVPDENGNVRRCGIQQIARILNQRGYTSARNDYWEKGVIRDILLNPTYAGKIRWGWRKTKRKTVGGTTMTERPRNYDEDCIVADGLHEAIVSIETFELAQKYLSELPPAPVGYKSEIKNPLAGLIVCGKCGRRMALRKATTPNKPDYIVCHARSCNNVGTPYQLVEARFLHVLETWLKEYHLKFAEQRAPISDQRGEIEKQIKRQETEISTLEKQLSSTYDLLEQGIYSVDEFRSRSTAVTAKISAAKTAIAELNEQSDKLAAMNAYQRDFIPKIERVLEAFEKLSSVPEKNELLKDIVDRAVYIKDKSGAFRDVSPDDFELTVTPKIPKS